MPSVIYRDPKIKINAVIYKDTTVRVKTLRVGTPIKKVTAGAFDISNLGGTDITGKTSGSILAYQALGGKWETTNFATGNNISITFDSAANTFTFGTNAALTNVTSLDATTTSTVRGVLSVTDAGGDGSLAYNNSTGVVTYTGPSASEARAHVSAVDGGGDGSFTYNSGTGAFTYTGPSAAEVRAHITANKGLNISSGELNIDSANVKGMFSGGTGVTYNNGVISIGQPVATSSDVTFNDVVISGDLTVSGTQTTVNTETLLLADNVIVVNSNATGTPSENGGIEVERGDATNKTLIWNEAIDKWTVGSETFVAGTFEGNLTGNVTGNVTGTVSSISNHTTANLTENTNLYHTTARARGAVSASGDLSYNSTTGVFSIDVEDAYTKVNFDSDLSAANTGQLPEGSNLYHTTARARGAVSVTDAGGDGSLAYNSSTGVITYTGASAAEVRAHFSAGGDLSYNSSTGQFSFDVESVYTKANFDSDLGIANTGQLPEGSNLYYTNARADARITTAAVTATGALMDSELTDLAGVKGVTISTLQPKPSEGAFVNGDKTKLDAIESGATADQTDAEIRTAVESATDSNVFTDADHSKLNAIEASATADQTDAEIKTAYENNSDTNAFTDAEKTKLSNIEASADVTDTANVTSAGALMDSEVTDLAGVKGVTISTLQVKPTEGAFADGDKTKLDGIEASADVTDTANVTSAGALMDSELTDLAGVKGVTISTLQPKPSEGAFANGDKTKLDGIEASADVTDTANVTAAGALMDSELTDLAGVKGVTISTLQVKPSEGAFANGDKTKLDGIEASADVTDTANVTSAGALMDSELTSIADVKALDQSVISGASPNFTTTNMSDATNKRFMTDAQESKLDGIEASATADQTDAEIRAAVEAATDSNVFTDADHSKLNAIEASADVTDTANVTAAGALMDSEVDADIKTLSLPANTTISAFGKTLVDDADAATARTTLGIDASGTDNSTNVTLAGSLDYITISGQEITRNAINLSTDVTGTLPVGNMAATALTTVQTAANESAHLALTAQEGDVVVRSDQNKTYMHNGGSAGTMNDYTLLATPTDAVTSVNGNTGVVTVTENVTTNLTITGTDAARTIVSSDGTNAVIPVATDSVSGVMSAADHTKLSGIETSADVTDTANVTSAGALMDSEVTNLAQVKAFDASDYATSAQGTKADSALQNVVEDSSPQLGGNLDLNSNNITGTGNISTTGDFTLTDTTSGSAAGPELTLHRDITGADANYLGQIKFTGDNDADQSNVFAKITGKISDASDGTEDGLIEFALKKAGSNNIGARLTSTDLKLINGTGLEVAGNITVTGTVDGRDVATDGTKLDGVEASADVTDTANVTAAGALMDSELTDLAGVKGVTISTLQPKPSEGAFANGDKTKLDAIEASADVTDTANVTAAGALMDSELTDLAGVKGVTISTLQVKPSEGAFADGDKTKLDAIEASADVTDTANVTAAGALMDSELTDLAGVKGVTISTLQPKPSEGAFANGDKTKLDGIEASADVTDTANVTSAGALMDSELASIADVKALDQSVVSGASPTFGTANMTDASNKRFMTDAQETKLDSVESSATADQTAAEILTAIKTVDGASSGLDADLLDGVQGASYLRSDANDTYTGDLTVTGTITTSGTIFVEDENTSSVSPLIKVQGTRSDGNASQAFSGGFALSRLRSAQKATNNTHLGTLYFGTNHTDGTAANIAYSASIAAKLSGDANSATDMPTDLVFYTGSAGTALGTANSTYGTERMRIDASGDVGIGSSAPTSLLHLASNAPYITFEDIDNNQDWQIQATAWFAIRDQTANAERMRIDASGNVSIAGGDLDLLDNGKIKLGTGDDLQLFHDGSDSYITEGGTGILFLRSNQLKIQSDDGLETYADFVDNGAVTLYFDNAAKLATVSGGINVTGTVTSDALTVDTTASNGATINAHDNATTTYPLKISNAAGSGNLELGTYGINNNIDLKLQRGGSTKLTVTSSGIDVTGTVEFNGLSGTGSVTVTDILDQDDMSSNSATMLATQQSIKAYVDANAGSMSNAQVRAAVEAATDSNVFTDADHSKLNGIEASATADQTAAQILTAIKTVDGSSSGLDADTLDGLQGASYLRSDADDAVNAYSTQITFPSNTSGASTSGDQASLEVRQSTGNSDAFMQFHIAGDYAGYFGLDGTTNDLFVGGWSYGANKHKIWHAGNDGSGSGLDADTLDGVQGASYLRSDANDTFTGTLTMAGQLQMNGNIINDVEDIYLRDKLYHDADTNNYFHFETDKQNFYTGGNRRLMVQDSGVTIGSGDTALGTSSGDITSGLTLHYTSSNNDYLLTEHKRVSAGSDWTTARHRIQRKVDSTLMGYIQWGGPNNADSLFSVGEGASTDYLTVKGDGDVHLSADLTVGQDLYFTDTNTKIAQNSADTLRVTSPSGYVDIGPQNTGNCHITTDRSQFYINKKLQVDEGIISSYNEDLQLRRTVGDTTNQLTIASGLATFGTQVTMPTLRVTGTGDASLTSTTHGLQVGATNSINIVMDGNEIIARSNGTNATLNLQLTGGGTTLGGALTIPSQIIHAGDTNTYLQFHAADEFRVVCSGNERFEVTNTNVTIPVDMTIADQIIHQGDTNTYMQFHAADQWRVVTGGSERLEVNNSQTTVNQNLDVVGTVDLRSDNNTAARYVHLPRGGGITFYGDAGASHSITSRNRTGSVADDLNISSYGAVYIHLDKNNNNSSGADFQIWKNNVTQLFEVSGESGNVTTIGDVTAFSDEKLKENIEVIPNAIEKVSQIRGVTFTRNDVEDKEKVYTGVIAQEVEKVLPEVVNTGMNDTKTVSYGNMVGLLIEAVKEQQEQINELKKQIEEMK